MSYKILIINPGSTSTKIGVYEDETQVMEETYVTLQKRLHSMQPSTIRKTSVKK